MAHHGDMPFGAYDKDTQDKMNDLREKLKDEHLKSQLGPTGDFPQGKLSKNDEGGITFAVGVRNQKVVIDFGNPVAWIGMDPGQAVALAQTLISHARRARIIGDKPVEVRIGAITE